jgi:hypothetical protein
VFQVTEIAISNDVFAKIHPTIARVVAASEPHQPAEIRLTRFDDEHLSPSRSAAPGHPRLRTTARAKGMVVTTTLVALSLESASVR